MTHNKRVLIVIILLSCIGALTSLYLVWNHYTTAPGICKIGGAVDCDLVNRGVYSEIFGFPVAGIGVLGYTALGGIALMLLLMFGHQVLFARLIRVGATIGFLFSLYLLYLELFVLLAICPFCMFSLLLITIITTLTWVAPVETHAAKANQ